MVARRFEPLTPCMPCSFGLLRSRWSGANGPLSGPRGVTVTVRGIPLVTAACGMRWHAPVRTMWLAPVGEGFPLAGRVRLTAGDDGLVGKPRSGAAASGRPGSRRSSRRLSCPRWAHATTAPGSDNRRRRGDQPSQRSPSFRDATGPDRHPSPYAREHAESIRATYFCIIVSTDYQSLRLRHEWD